MEEKTLTLQYQTFQNIDDLAADEKELLEKAREAMAHAYSPYSKFQVGAALRLANGSIITGTNQENASYGLTVCGERSALFAAGSKGYAGEGRKLAIIGSARDTESTSPVTPCGACRQVIKEYEDVAGSPFVILLSGKKGEIYRMVGIENLLPFAFGPKDLEK